MHEPYNLQNRMACKTGGTIKHLRIQIPKDTDVIILKFEQCWFSIQHVQKDEGMEKTEGEPRHEKTCPTR